MYNNFFPGSGLGANFHAFRFHLCLLNAIIFFLRTVLFAHILKYASGALLLMEVNEVNGQDHFKISLFQALNCKLAVNIILMILCMCRE